MREMRMYPSYTSVTERKRGEKEIERERGGESTTLVNKAFEGPLHCFYVALSLLYFKACQKNVNL